ncbi:hypothetical protein Q8A67_020408 [Cirrhinus molitorella]|uniref:Uncharacterized protein n=1 Tax=Cirrhinus molitorella TaxID=172907 RepID=A0AA88P7P1_9TELE|nr:hypothetical protein Q8A67_020408 [Cirrhinus molitorella]
MVRGPVPLTSRPCPPGDDLRPWSQRGGGKEVPSNFPKESTAEESLCSFDREGGCCVNILCERMPFERLNRALGDLSRAARRVLAFIPTPGW